MQLRVGRRKVGQLLASSSVAALLVGGGALPAFAGACYTGPFPFTNLGAQTCISATGTSFSGNITNAAQGTITAGATAPTNIGITVNNSTINGAIINQGTVTAPSGSGIRVFNNAVVSGGISNTGMISVSGTGAAITLTALSSFGGGISNNGTISAAGNAIFIGFSGLGGPVSTFTGGITNSGIVSAGGTAININAGISLFAGSIVNTNTIVAAARGISVFDVVNFAGSISNGGVINAGFTAISVAAVSSFGGGITNSGTVSAALGTAILVNDVVTFAQGISNGGLLAGISGINVSGTQTFLGGISNNGTVSAFGGVGIFVGGTSPGPASLTIFSGGITNSGSIAAPGTGIAVAFVSTFYGGISNSGTISSALAAGIAVVGSGVETFLGGITNGPGGVITAAGSGIAVSNLASFDGGITNRGLINASGVGIFVQGVSLFTGGISNSGTITGGVSGIHICSCVVTFMGGITNSGVINGVSAGIVVEAQSFDGHIVNTGTITGGFAAIDLTLVGNAVTIDQNAGLIGGNILFSPFGDTLNVRGGAINGNIVGQNAGDTINFALGAGTFTYGAAFGFANVSFVNVDSGVVVLDGANQAGSIAVNGGVLQVGDAANTGATLTGSVDVIGGTLSGHGTVVGDVTIESGGVLFPGGSIGTLTIANGPLTFNAGSTYLVQIAPGAGNNSATIVNGAPGNAAINGGTVLALPQLGHYNATTYTILTASGGVNGTFAGAGFAAPFTYTGTETLTYDANDAFLNLGAGFALLAPAGTNQNQQSVVNGINGFILGSGSSPPPQFANLANLPAPTLLNALSQLSGENNAGFMQGALQAGNSFLGLLLNPYVDGRGGSFVPAVSFATEDRPALPDAALAFAKLVKAAPRDATLGSVPQFRVWGAAYGGSGTVDGDATVGSHTTTATEAAFAAGVDYLLSPHTTLGFALAGGGTSWSLDAGFGSGRSDMFQAGVYARERFGNAYLAGALAYNFHDVTTNRTVTVAGTDMLQGRFQANGIGARLDGGYRQATPWLAVTPYGAVQIQSIFLPGYGEAATAGSNQFALNFASQTLTATRTELGAWLDRSLLVDRGRLLTLYGRLAWAHDFGDTPSASAIFQALPGSNFIVNGATPNPDSALVTAGAKYDLMNGWSFLAKFDGDFSSNTSIFSGTGAVRKVW